MTGVGQVQHERDNHASARMPDGDAPSRVARELSPSRYADPFARLRLPPADQWPQLEFDLPSLVYPDELNCADALLKDAIRQAGPSSPAIITDAETWTYADLLAAANRYARVLTEDLGLRSGGRVLLRGGNTPALFACWLAVVKAGGIAVTTMPLLRAAELSQIVRKAEADLALCDVRLADELTACAGGGAPTRVVLFGTPDAELDGRAARKPSEFTAAPASQDDVCLIAFTSGTTGQPKAALHFHRDVMSMCHTYAAHRLPRGERPVFCGTPPIGFTFGLGALLAFPLFFGAAVVLPSESAPGALADAIRRHRVTHVFTSPTGYRAMLEAPGPLDLSSLQVAVSAGEHLPTATSEAWFQATGLRLLDGIGATEMIHIFISSDPDDVRPGSVGKPVPGYTVALLDDDGQPVEGEGAGRLAVRGPVGCRYLNDPRQGDYVQHGWNLTGDMFRRDADGFYWFVARADDMIISSGYNIAGPEVEGAILSHRDVAECVVVGAPDARRGQVVKAYVVLKPDAAPAPETAKALQDHVKAILAPYKYPRLVEFVAELPRTTTGKLSRRALRDAATAGDRS